MDGGKFLLQLLKIVIGFVLALIASGVFLAWGFFQAAHPGENPVAFGAMVGTGLVAASVTGAAVMLPVGIAIAIAEFARLKGIVFHLAAGGGIAFLIWTLGPEAGAETGVGGVRPGSVIALAAGFFAGLVYWIIAGRTSGCWLQRSADPSGNSDI